MKRFALLALPLAAACGDNKTGTTPIDAPDVIIDAPDIDLSRLDGKAVLDPTPQQLGKRPHRRVAGGQYARVGRESPALQLDVVEFDDRDVSGTNRPDGGWLELS